MHENSPRSENLQELDTSKGSQTSSKSMEVNASISTTHIFDVKEVTETAPEIVENSLAVETNINNSIQKEKAKIGQDTQDQLTSFEEIEKKSALSVKIAPNNALKNDQDDSESLITPTQANPGDLFNDENLLNRRPGAPTQLNLVVKQQQKQGPSTKKQSLIL